MKIKLSTFIKALFCFFLLIECEILQSIGINIPYTDRISLLLTIMVGIYVRCSSRLYSRVSKYCKFLNPFMMAYCAFMIVEGLYSLVLYSPNGISAISMIIVYRYLFYPLWIYPLLYVIDTDGNWEGLLKIIFVIGVVDTGIKVISYLAYSTARVVIFPSIVEKFTSNIRNDRYRLGAGTFHTLAFNIALYYAAVLPKRKQRRKYFLIAALFCWYQLFISMGRTQIICYLITIIAYIYFVYCANSKYRTYYRFFLVVIATIAFGYALFSDFLGSYLSTLFTNDRNLSENAASTIARMYAIGYYWSIVKEHVLLGLGLLYNDGKELLMILRGYGSGYAEIAYTEDLGFLGQFFNYGFIGTLILGALLIRWMTTTIKAYKNGKRKQAALLIPLFVHGITQTFTSMSLFQANKFVYIPIYLVIFEYALFKSERQIKDGEKIHY